MRDARRLVMPVFALAAGVALLAVMAGPPRTAASPERPRRISAAERAATFRFASGTSEGDRAAFLAAVADARPPARRLIGTVDGLVDVRFGSTGVPGALGLTESGGPRFTVTVELGRVAAVYGRRGIDRVVLHELGHVIDHALVPADVMTRLQAGIPAGYGCDAGTSGACAAPPERFAESFAKWATGDIGVDLYVGYKVPPPGPTLAAWGAPLARLGS
jgi:hypothetical protein